MKIKTSKFLFYFFAIILFIANMIVIKPDLFGTIFKDFETSSLSGSLTVITVLSAAAIMIPAVFAKNASSFIHFRSNIICAVTSFIFSAALVYEGILSITGKYNYVLDGSKYIYYSVLSWLSAIILICFSISFVTAKPIMQNAPVLALLPCAWSAYRMTVYFLKYTRIANISGQYYDILFMASSMIFFLSAARLMSNFDIRRSIKSSVAFGYTAALFAFLYSGCRYLYLLSGGDESVYLKMFSPRIIDIAFVLFAVSFCSFFVSRKNRFHGDSQIDGKRVQSEFRFIPQSPSAVSKNPNLVTFGEHTDFIPAPTDTCADSGRCSEPNTNSYPVFVPTFTGASSDPIYTPVYTDLPEDTENYSNENSGVDETEFSAPSFVNRTSPVPHVSSDKSSLNRNTVEKVPLADDVLELLAVPDEPTDNTDTVKSDEVSASSKFKVGRNYSSKKSVKPSEDGYIVFNSTDE